MKKMIALVTLIALMLVGCCGCMAIPRITKDIPYEVQFETLLEKAIDYAEADDFSAFSKLLVNADEATAQDFFENFKKVVSDHKALTDRQYFVPLVIGNNFMGCALWSRCDGTFPNTNFSTCSTVYACLTKHNVCRFDCAEDVAEEINEQYLSMLPESAANADAQNRNAAWFYPNDLSWTDSSIVVPGSFVGHLYFAWENADGSVSVMVNVKNGTDQLVYLKSVNVILSKKTEAGTPYADIINEAFSVNEMIHPGSNKTYTFTVERDRVLSIDSEWGQVSCDCTLDYD